MVANILALIATIVAVVAIEVITGIKDWDCVSSICRNVDFWHCQRNQCQPSARAKEDGNHRTGPRSTSRGRQVSFEQ